MQLQFFCISILWRVTCWKEVPFLSTLPKKGRSFTVQLDARSLIAPLFSVAIDRQQQTHHTTPHHPTERDTRHDTAPHNKNTDTHEHAHENLHAHEIHTCLKMYVYVYVCKVFTILKKKHSGTSTFRDAYCSKPLTFHKG